MPRYQRLFRRLAHHGQQGAFIPFVQLGDPTPALSMQIIDTLIAAGADALELGMPFSDPLADGPTLQAAAQRALAAGTTLASCFAMLANVRYKYPTLPIGLLMYANLVFNKGINTFYQCCARADVDSVLVADVPLTEAGPFRQAAIDNHIAPIFICPPNADTALMQKIAAAQSRGYTYLLARAGVTGVENPTHAPLAELAKLVAQLRHYGAAPPLLGFGIATPAQVKVALSAGVTGVISGSAVVNIISDNLTQPATMLATLSDFVTMMKGATHKMH